MNTTSADGRAEAGAEVGAEQSPITALSSLIVWVTWIWAVIFVPIETYLSWIHHPFFSEYVVNVLGVGIALWGAHSLRKARPYAPGLLATGWGWTTAVFWRGTNLRYWDAAHGQPLYFGHAELWLGPTFTIIAGGVLSGSLVLLLRHKTATVSVRSEDPAAR